MFKKVLNFKKKRIKNFFFFKIIFFPEPKIDCRTGDGKGGNEKRISGKYTVQECVTEVKKQHPTANGASMNIDCSNKCSCWAEFNMDRWEGSSYQACKFKNTK